MDELAAGIHRWTAPHPEWRPKSEEVESYALIAGEALLLVDPLVPARRTSGARRSWRSWSSWQRPRRVWSCSSRSRITRAARRRCTSASRPQRPTRIRGHALVRRRLRPETPLEVVPMGAAGTAAPIAGGAAEAYTIGRPRRSEHPMYVPSLRAAVFGDAVVGAEGGLRFWTLSSGTGADWYRDVFAPSFRELAERPLEHVLVAHGPPVVGDGQRQLALCLAAPPVAMY